MEQPNSFRNRVDEESLSIQRQTLQSINRLESKVGGSGGGGLSSMFAGGYDFAGNAPGFATNQGAALQNLQRVMDQNRVSTSLSQEQQQLKAMQTGASLGEGAVRLAGGAANVGLGAGGAAIGTVFGGPVGGVVGGLAGDLIGSATVGLLAGSAVNQLNRENTYSRYAFQNSNYGIDIFNSTNTRGIGGLSLSESRQTGRVIDSIARDNFLNSGEMQSLVMNASENGLLRGSSDMQDYQNKLRDLAKDTRAMAQALNSTIDEIGTLFGALNKLVGTVKDGNNLLVQSKITGGIVGVDGSLLAESILNQSAGMVSGTGLSGGNVVGNISKFEYIGARMLSELESLDDSQKTRDQATAENYMRNIGRENIGAALQQTVGQLLENENTGLSSSLLAAYDVDANGNLVYNSQKAKSLRGKGLNEITAESVQVANQLSADEVANWKYNASQIAINDMSTNDLLEFIRTHFEAASASSGGTLNTQTYLSSLGLNADQAAFFSQALEVDATKFNMSGNLASTLQWQQENRAEKGSLTDNIGRFFGNVGTWMNQNLNPLYLIGSGVNSLGSAISTGWDNLWYGKQLSAEDLTLDTDLFLVDNDERVSLLEDYESKRQKYISNFDTLSEETQSWFKQNGFHGSYLAEASPDAARSSVLGNSYIGDVTSVWGQKMKGSLALDLLEPDIFDADDIYAYRRAMSLMEQGVTADELDSRTGDSKVKEAFNNLESWGQEEDEDGNIVINEEKMLTAFEHLRSGLDLYAEGAALSADAQKIQDNFNTLLKSAGYGGTDHKGQMDFLIEQAWKYNDETGEFEDEKFSKSMIGRVLASDEFREQQFNVVNLEGQVENLTGAELQQAVKEGRISAAEWGERAIVGTMEARTLLNDAIADTAAEDPLQAGLVKSVTRIEDYVRIIAQKSNKNAVSELDEAAQEEDTSYVLGAYGITS